MSMCRCKCENIIGSDLHEGVLCENCLEKSLNDIGFVIDDNHIPQIEGSPEKMREKIRKLNDKISKLEFALHLIIDEYKAPDELLRRGLVCGLTSMQQAGILEARKLL